MEYISSDTNIWIDFHTINRLNMPFLLPITYIMSADAINDELCYPSTLKHDLLNLGLKGVEIDGVEFMLAREYGSKYCKLSIYDRIALAIAKNRGLVLLTGDGILRKAADYENVKVMGTLGLIDKLYKEDKITDFQYDECITLLQQYNGKKIRLPKDQISLRLDPFWKILLKTN